VETHKTEKTSLGDQDLKVLKVFWSDNHMTNKWKWLSLFTQTTLNMVMWTS